MFPETCQNIWLRRLPLSELILGCQNTVSCVRRVDYSDEARQRRKSKSEIKHVVTKSTLDRQGEDNFEKTE